MNVEYRCPICQHRGFFPPNTPIYKCITHTDTIMEQVEEFQGPNFFNKEEGEVNPNKTGVVTMGAFTADGKTTITPVRDKPPEPISDEEALRQARELYERLTGEPADKRLGIKRLHKEIEDLERDAALALERAAQEAELAKLEAQDA